eukprot:765351-Hanusia_phi.AAC.2
MSTQLNRSELVEVEEVWDGGFQDGIRIKSLPESLNDSSPLQCGDIIVSVEGVDCTKLSIPEVFQIIANKNPLSSNFTLVVKRKLSPVKSSGRNDRR